jgi:hypothetical protein
MAIKDLMKATKADRYTADGRDELNKALKADVEDRTYKTGEISQKTGLQKQPDGSWAPPKKDGNPGAKSGEETLKPSRKPDQKKNPRINNPDVLGMTANGARKRMEAFGAQFVENKNGKDYFKTTSGDLVEVEYGDNKKVLSSTTYTGGEKPEQVYPTTAGHDIESYINKLHEEGWKNDGWERNSANGALGYFKKGDKTIRVMQNWNGTLGGVSEIKPKAESKPAEAEKNKHYKEGQTVPQASAMQSRMRHREKEAMKTYEELKQKGANRDETYTAAQLVRSSRELGDLLEVIAKFPDDPINEATAEKLNSMLQEHDRLQKEVDYITNKNTDESTDTAPHELTGDTRLRLSQVTDKVYQIGEISQKTGLQKTANGWRPVKKGADQKWMEKKEKKTAKEIMSKAGPGRTFELKMGENGQPTLGKEVKTYETRKEAQEALNKQKTESKPAAESNLGNYPGWKPNKVEFMGDDTGYRIEGTQFYFDTPEEAQTAILAKSRGDRNTYARPSKDKTINEIQNALGFKLDTEYGGKHSMDDFMKKIGEDEYGVRVWSFGTDSKGTLIDYFGEGPYAEPNATIKKENGEWKLHYDRDGKKTVVTATGREYPTGDAAPRELTGDCKIRVRRK